MRSSSGWGHERAPERHALTLAAGEGAGPTLQQRFETQQRHDPVERRIAPVARREAEPVEQVAAHAEVREEAAVLKHVADPAALRLEVDPGFRVEEHPVFERDPPGLRLHEARDRIGQRGLAGARGAEQRDHAIGLRAERGIERELAPSQSRFDRQHYPSNRRLTMRARNSEPISAAKAMTMAITIRRKAPSSPPGTCVYV